MTQKAFLISLFFALYACNFVSGSEDTTAIGALLDLIWIDPPNDIDLVVLQRRIGRPLNRETERAFLDKTFAAFPDSHPMKKLRQSDPKEYQRSIEATIDDAILRKEAQQLFRYRYSTDRWNGDAPRFRRDRLSHKDSLEELTSDTVTSLDPVDSWVNSGDIVDGHYESLEYEGGANRLDRFLDSDKPKWSTNDLWRLWGPGGGVWLLLRNSCGTVDPGSKAVVRDVNKERALFAGEHKLVSASQSVVDLSGTRAYLIELYLNEFPKHAAFKVWSQHDRPRNVFRCEGFDPRTGQQTSCCEMNNRDANGLVHHWKEEKFESGDRTQLDEFRIIRIIDPAETGKDVFREGAFERTFTLTHFPDRIVTSGPNGTVSVQAKKPGKLNDNKWRYWLVGVNTIVVIFVLGSIIRRSKTAPNQAGANLESK